MGMVKKEFVEYEIGLESMKAGLEWMTRYGVKTFKDTLANGWKFVVLGKWTFSQGKKPRLLTSQKKSHKKLDK